MPFDAYAKEVALDAIAALANGAAGKIAIHSDDPGAGDTNENSDARQDPTFGAASGDSVALTSELIFSGPASAPATWFTVWDGTDRIGKGQITSGDTNYNAEGVFHLQAGTSLRITDPA